MNRTRRPAPGIDSDLLAALRNRAEGYRDSLPVYQTLQPTREESIASARRLLPTIWPDFADCAPQVVVVGDNPVVASMQLPGDGHLRVFHPSAAIAASRRSTPGQTPIATDESQFDRKPLTEVIDKHAHAIAQQYVRGEESLHFESHWELKGRGVSVPSDKNARSHSTPVALFEVLGAFRRYLGGIPVLGRASIHVAVGLGSMVTRWGVDWRGLHSEPLTHTAIIDPEQGARRVLEDLWRRRPESAFTLEDFQINEFKLGYVSFSRRREQYVMQPAWIAMLAPRGATSMAHSVAVPAAPQEFESMARPAKVQVGR